MRSLTVDLEIPFETDPLIGVPAFTFTHWLPIGEHNGILASEDQINILLWFDIQTARWGSQPKEEDLIKHVNVLARYVKARITVQSIEDNLAEYMQKRSFKRLPSDSEKDVQSMYSQLGERILRIVLEHVNRLISYARDFKGQYWLLKYDYNLDQMYSLFNKFDGLGKIDDKEWFRFQPGVGDTIRVEMTPEEKYITEGEWKSVCEFVVGRQSAPLVGELLAGAEQLEGNGYGRSALTEAVTALEVAISDFGSSQSASEKLTSVYGERLGIGSLKKQIKRMGLNGTVRYLLPLILPEAILPSKVITACQEAVTLRQNVVHNGSRNVSVVAVRKGISNIKKCCKILDKFTKKSGEKKPGDV